MARFGLTTCWLQISCSSQAELHWHDVCKQIGWFKMFPKLYALSNHFNNHKIWKISMKYIPPKKLKVLSIMFFAAAGFGIFSGLFLATSGMQGLMITLLGVVNLCLGGFMGFLLLTQKPYARDSRKYKKK